MDEASLFRPEPSSPAGLYGGWVCLWRKIQDNPRRRDPGWFCVFTDLLLNATHRPIRAYFDGKEIILQPGQLITGRFAISRRTGVQESKVRRVLERLKADQQIDQQGTNTNSLITILNWSTYQQTGQQIDQPLTSRRPATDQQVTTNNKLNNETTEFTSLEASSKPGKIPGEDELLADVADLIGKSSMENWGGLWRDRIRQDAGLVRRVTADVRSRALEVSIENAGGYADDLWKRFAPSDSKSTKGKK